MSVLFIGVGGLDYHQPEVIKRLHHFLRSAQETIYSYEGSINKLAVDDKGTIFIALFGAPPYAHQDDPKRAVQCALSLQQMAQSQNLQLAIGVTTGRVFAGPVGSETRREYTVMGDTVNLAARLMGAAGLGQVRCDDETYRLSHNSIHFETLPPVRLKGKAGLIPLYKPLSEAKESLVTFTKSQLVGRQNEIAAFTACLDDIQAKQSRILILKGEAGIGKSRLVEELRRLIRERGLIGLLGMGRSIEQNNPYRAWRDIFTNFFGIDDLKDPLERQQQVQSHVQEVTPDLVERLPILNDILDLGFPENNMTASLDTEIRHESLVSLLLALLKAWASEQPLILILEDAHWLDRMSWDLTLQVARALNVARVPLLLIVAMRPLEGEDMRIEPMMLTTMDEAEEIPLDSLSAEETIALAAYRLGLSVPDLPEEIADLVRKRAGGNPFFAEELVYTLRDKGLFTLTTEQGRTRCHVSGNLARELQTLPDTIQGVVLSRIDRLPPEQQLTLKVAAVIGRTFGYTPLYQTLDHYTDLSKQRLKTYLEDLSSLDLTPVEVPEPELTYIFKHIITQEVAYETLLFAQRRQLHRTVAEWHHEKFGAGSVESPPKTGLASIKESPLTPFYPILAYHWRQAEDKVWERHYTWLAGQRAANQFANDDAAQYFSRALTLTAADDIEALYQLLLAREAVNDLRGEREAQAEDLAALETLAEASGKQVWQATVALQQANYAEVMSDYPASLKAAQKAVELAKVLGDQEMGAEGHIAWGKVLWRQGDYEAAHEQFDQAITSAKGTNNRYNEAKSLYYLGQVYLYQDNHSSAQNRRARLS
jgi:predicted ATPase